MLLLTVDTVPWQHEIMRLLWVYEVGRGTPEIDKALARLGGLAASVGASGVIGIRFAFTEDVAERLTGTGTHIVTVAYGTAVKW
jgi:hypothetical protein